jgi:hypothetical protein
VVLSARRRRALRARHMWTAIAALVVWHEAACEPDELLSAEVDRMLVKHPLAVYGFTAVTVSHLLNWLPKSVDPYRAIGKYKKGNNV